MYLPEFCIFSCYAGGPSGVQTHIEPAIQVLVKIYFINKNMKVDLAYFDPTYFTLIHPSWPLLGLLMIRTRCQI